MPGLIAPPAQIWLCVAPMDLRRGMDGLSSWVQTVLQQSPCAGSAFVFRNGAGNRIKVLLWDANGVWLCQRRLHRGRFAWPKAEDRSFSLTLEEWHWLITGVEWQRLSAPLPVHWQV